MAVKKKAKRSSAHHKKKKRRIKTDVYTVLKVSGTAAVITHAAGDAKRPLRLKVYTSIPVSPGQRVKIGFATKNEGLLDFLCLAVPLLCATAACLLLPEAFKAAGVVVSCVAASIITGVVTYRCRGNRGNTLQITGVVG